MDTFAKLESEVRSYCRSFPTVFTRANGSTMWNEEGRSYVDFFAGAGALNYGHNHPDLKRALLRYVADDGITHSLDMATGAKRRFLETFQSAVLAPRGYDYKVMFPGPTGTNAVEAALKLARKVTGRTNVVAFSNGFHGMTLGSLALTGNGTKRGGAGVPLAHTTHMPFCGYLGRGVDTLAALEEFLSDHSSGVDSPAAFVVETVQAEGGVNVASAAWMRGLAALARRFGALLVVDDIQVGCGRTGPFFSFEQFDIEPDVVCLSKSLSGYGIPFAVTLMKPELDRFEPGEHNGTFRGHNLAFVTATAALERFWRSDELSRKVQRDAKHVREALTAIAAECGGVVRGRGMIQGVELPDPESAGAISRAAFERGLIIETAGPRDEVVKLLPPLTIEREELDRGLEILSESAHATLGRAVSTAGNGKLS